MYAFSQDRFIRTVTVATSKSASLGMGALQGPVMPKGPAGLTLHK